jgi:hypothetical protein
MLTLCWTLCFVTLPVERMRLQTRDVLSTYISQMMASELLTCLLCGR